MFLTRKVQKNRILNALTTLSLSCSVQLVAITEATELQPPQPSELVLKAQQERIASMAFASKATVAVHGADGQGGGSGVCISPDGYVLTNYHVSSPFGHRMKCGMNDGKMYDCVVAGIDPTGDLAVLKMYGRDDFPVAKIGNSDTVRAGHWCFAAGNPFILATNLKPTITLGIVSGVRRYQYPSGTILEYSDCIQTDAAINPGNSGGPLFNMAGELIGINGRCSFEKRGRVNVGVGYAISINQAMNFFWQLRSGRIVDHATLGFTVSTDSSGRVVVSNILESSDAFRRGLRYGDEIIRIGDRDIDTSNQLKNVLGIYPELWRIPVRYRNEEGIVNTHVRLQNLHLSNQLVEIVAGENNKPPQPTPKLPPAPKPETPSPNPEVPEEGKNPPESLPPESLPPESLPPESLPPESLPAESLPAESIPAEAPDNSDKSVDALADRYVERTGFANYYFNLQEIQRIVDLQTQHTNFTKAQKESISWGFEGKFPAEETSYSGEWSDTSLVMLVGQDRELLPAVSGWQNAVKKKSAANFAMALRIWQLWHKQGPLLMGETVYFGRNPIVGQPGLFDMTRIVFGEVTCHVFTNPQNGEFKLIEIYADSMSDPAEIYFESFREEAGQRLPAGLRLQFGLETELVASVEKYHFNDSGDSLGKEATNDSGKDEPANTSSPQEVLP